MFENYEWSQYGGGLPLTFFANKDSSMTSMTSMSGGTSGGNFICVPVGLVYIPPRHKDVLVSPKIAETKEIDDRFEEMLSRVHRFSRKKR